ncbi:hypothetical protein VZ95_04550 [Elstera litoralis]|uniref:Lipoprotein n=1 Tax=Elstera litoralis TaxID=552518 RepID=A0A0F3IY07_9PROT|nr:hypothetical protein [Elstera litoralis]KJV10489.1 hypothetical protein VZ95_04550 [Elstera litoralis]
MKTKTKFLTALTAAVLMLPSCAPSGMTRVSQTDISSAYTRTDLSISAARGAVPVIFSGVVPATDKARAERALLAALPTHYTANLAWRAASPADQEGLAARLVLAFGPDPIYPADRLCGLKPGFTIAPPSPTEPVRAVAAYCRGPSALSSTVGDVIDAAGIEGTKAQALVGDMTNALLPTRVPGDDDFRRPLFLRVGS